MRTSIYLSVIVLFITVSGFKWIPTSTLLPPINRYFSSLDLSKKQEKNGKLMDDLRNNIQLSEIGGRHTYLIKGDGTDASVFAQIILSSLLKDRKFKKADVLSCTPTASITEAGLQTLKEVGYVMSYKEGFYTVQYSAKDKPLKIMAYSCTDKKFKKNQTMNISVAAANSFGEDGKTLNYSNSDSKDLFRSLATDIYSMVKELRKEY